MNRHQKKRFERKQRNKARIEALMNKPRCPNRRYGMLTSWSARGGQKLEFDFSGLPINHNANGKPCDVGIAETRLLLQQPIIEN
mgnify:CR=1 FL=1